MLAPDSRKKQRRRLAHSNKIVGIVEPTTRLGTTPLTYQRTTTFGIHFQAEEQQLKAQRESEAKKKEQEAFAKMEVAKKKMLQDEEARRAEVRACLRF